MNTSVDSRQADIQAFFETVHRVFRQLKNGGGFPLNEVNLSGAQLRLVFLISDQADGATVKDIAQDLGITSGAVTQQIDELVAAGYVTRTEDPTDRRLIRITVSPKTRGVLSSLKTKFFRHVEPMFNNLTNQEVKTLRDLITKVRFND